MKKTLFTISALALVATIGIAVIQAAITGVSVDVSSSELAVTDTTAAGGSFVEFGDSSVPTPTTTPASGELQEYTASNGTETYVGTTEPGKYTAEQIAYATGFQRNGPFNPSKGSPWGLHDKSLLLPQTWDWAVGAKANGGFQTFFRPTFQWRGAVFVANGETAPTGHTIQIRNSQMWSFSNNDWSKVYDVSFTAGNSGAYLSNSPLGQANPFAGGQNHGTIQWQNLGSSLYQAPFVGPQLMHFWEGVSPRTPFPAGHNAEIAIAEIRVLGPNNSNVDGSSLVAQIGLDYYNAGENNHAAPGPGIARYRELTSEWVKLAWITTPQGTPVTYYDTVDWIDNNPPPFLVQ